ncbi:MAG: NlpC/P60 family protein [Emergencia sp.]
MNFLKQKISKKYVIAGAVVLAIAVFAAVTSFQAYANEDYWAVKIGDDTVAVFSSESKAKQVIRDVKNHYITEGAEVRAISCTPEMTVEQQTYRIYDRPETAAVDETVDYILSGTREKVTYTVKSGDSAWSIAESHGFTVEELAEMNDTDVESIAVMFPGDELKLYQTRPMVNVTVTQLITSEKKIKYETVTEKSSSVLLNTTVVKQEGVYGKKQVTELVTTENGKVIESEVQASEILKSPKKEIVVKGTGTLSAPTGGRTYDGDGQAIASYALKFVGNPYVYGGSSLTKGADCSGFVMAVYKHFGIIMAHDADAMRNYGREVSLAEARPGDLVCHYGHVGIYIGGGMIVHAVNEGMGIAVTGASYTGPVITVRRIVE